MTPDDVSTVQRSWGELRGRRVPLLVALTDRFEQVLPSLDAPALRAGWLLVAVEELVDLLSTPSRLAAHAQVLGVTWPDPLTAPSFTVDGRAWMEAARECVPAWTARTDAAWRQAWLVLADVLAAEALSPFTDGPES